MKKVPFATKPPSPTADEWVNARPAAQASSQPEDPARGEATKRLTIDVSASLHRRIKIQCAQREMKIADEVRRLLEEHFPDGGGDGGE